MEILKMISDFFSYLLPILGVAVLAVLLVILLKLLKFCKSLLNISETVNKSLTTVDGYISEMQTTVKTINNVSLSVEAVRFTLSNMIKKAIDSWTQEYETVKKMLTTLLDKVNKKPENNNQENVQSSNEANNSLNENKEEN